MSKRILPTLLNKLECAPIRHLRTRLSRTNTKTESEVWDKLGSYASHLALTFTHCQVMRDMNVRITSRSSSLVFGQQQNKPPPRFSSLITPTFDIVKLPSSTTSISYTRTPFHKDWSNMLAAFLTTSFSLGLYASFAFGPGEFYVSFGILLTSPYVA